MLVREVMTDHVECLAPHDTLQHAAQQMKSLDVGSMPVCDGDHVVGIVTDRDIVLRCVANGADVVATRVRDAMSEGVTFCFEDDDLDTASRVMQQQQIRRLLVLNREKKLAGILSLGDLAVKSSAKDCAAKALEEISEPAHEVRHAA